MNMQSTIKTPKPQHNEIKFVFNISILLKMGRILAILAILDFWAARPAPGHNGPARDMFALPS